MIAVGIMFLLLGSVPYIVKKLDGFIPPLSKRIYQFMFYTGVSVLVLSVIGSFASDPFDFILPVLPVLVLGLYMVRIISVINKRVINE